MKCEESGTVPHINMYEEYHHHHLMLKLSEDKVNESRHLDFNNLLLAAFCLFSLQ